MHVPMHVYANQNVKNCIFVHITDQIFPAAGPLSVTPGPLLYPKTVGAIEPPLTPIFNYIEVWKHLILFFAPSFGMWNGDILMNINK